MQSTWGLTVVTPPAAEPLTAAELAAHGRIYPIDADVDTLTAYGIVAREYVETVSGRQIMPATWKLTLDQFPGVRVDDRRPSGWRYGTIRLPRPPLVSISSVKYIDPDGTLQTADPSTYQVDATTEPGRLGPARFTIWPQTDPQSFAAVQVTFVCGYASADAVPQKIKQAIRLLTAHLWENREATTEAALAVVPIGLQSMISSCGYGEYE